MFCSYFLPLVLISAMASAEHSQLLLKNIERTIHYHLRTKHHFQRYSRSLGYMDWANQPNPFRRFPGASIVQLPKSSGDILPRASYEDLYKKGAIRPLDLSLDLISAFLEHALGVTAWKQSGSARWALRSNPSSGNLHPTEGYVMLPDVDDAASAGLYHYAPKDHVLERRALFRTDDVARLLDPFPPGSFLLGLSSVYWREAWKYGERAFRYCNHDIGHAIGSARIAAAMMGWDLLVLDGISDKTVNELLGTSRYTDFFSNEKEHGDLIAVVWPQVVDRSESDSDAMCRDRVNIPLYLNKDALRLMLDNGTWYGTANKLSNRHEIDWDIIDEVSSSTIKLSEERVVVEYLSVQPQPAGACLECTPSATPSNIIRQRRSALDFDGRTTMTATSFFKMLSRICFPSVNSGGDEKVLSFNVSSSLRPVPWDAWPYDPTIHLVIFVHRVVGLEPGTYLLIRDTSKMEFIKESLGASFPWTHISNSLGLPLFLFQKGDTKVVAKRLSCNQDIAADGTFSVGMLAEFEGALKSRGPWWYRRMFWEAGLLGHVLYLEAEALGLRATGIGCFFDDPVHELVGIDGKAFQSLYHLAVGGPVLDTRLVG